MPFILILYILDFQQNSWDGGGGGGVVWEERYHNNCPYFDDQGNPICLDGQAPIPDTFCGRGPDRADCAVDTEYCLIHPTDLCAVCCPNSESPGQSESETATTTPPKEEACGDVVCPAGEYCCNLLCSICAQEGYACIQGCWVEQFAASSYSGMKETSRPKAAGCDYWQRTLLGQIYLQWKEEHCIVERGNNRYVSRFK